MLKGIEDPRTVGGEVYWVLEARNAKSPNLMKRLPLYGNCLARDYISPKDASKPLCTSLSTTSGLKISKRNFSCCRSSKALSVGPGYNKYLVYDGVVKYCRYLR